MGLKQDKENCPTCGGRGRKCLIRDIKVANCVACTIKLCGNEPITSIVYDSLLKSIEHWKNNIKKTIVDGDSVTQHSFTLYWMSGNEYSFVPYTNEYFPLCNTLADGAQCHLCPLNIKSSDSEVCCGMEESILIFYVNGVDCKTEECLTTCNDVLRILKAVKKKLDNSRKNNGRLVVGAEKRELTLDEYKVVIAKIYESYSVTNHNITLSNGEVVETSMTVPKASQ